MSIIIIIMSIIIIVIAILIFVQAMNLHFMLCIAIIIITLIVLYFKFALPWENIEWDLFPIRTLSMMLIVIVIEYSSLTEWRLVEPVSTPFDLASWLNIIF